MISKYNDYINESKIISLILEGNLHCTSYFLDRIGKIREDSKIADVLDTIFNNNYYIKDSPQNYINIDEEEDDKISFISDKKADTYEDGYEYEEKGRSTIKIGRFVRAFFNDKNVLKDLLNTNSFRSDELNFSDKEIENFVNLYKSASKSKNNFKLVKGDLIKKWYHEDSYADLSGNLASSCMADVDEDYFDIYSKSDTCSLLILTNSDNKLLGRALVWKLSESPCEAKYFMDRVYAFNDSDVVRFINYAIEKGWMYKYKMNSTSLDSVLFLYNKKPVFGKISVKVKNASYRKYPYLDTLCFINMDKYTLSNIGYVDGEKLQETDGTKEECSDCGGKGVDCPKCDGDELIACAECDGEGTIECTKCDGENDKCNKCKGEGEIECKECDGTGEVKCTECENHICDDCLGRENYAKRNIKAGYAPEFKSVIKSL